MIAEKALAIAQEIYDEVKYADVRSYDWKERADRLFAAEAFTTPQVAAILGISVQYLQRYVREQHGTVKDKGKRSRYGVSGNFDPETLTSIRMLRSKESGRKNNGKYDSYSIELMNKLLETNGVRTLSFLTGVSEGVLNRVKKYGE